VNLHRYPDLIDRLAGEYALGVLRGGARRRLERLAEHDAAVRAAIETWRARVASMTELAAPVEPPASAWTAIEHRLGLAHEIDARAADAAAAIRARTAAGGERAAAARRSAARARWFDDLAFWRGWSIAATGAAFAAVVALAVTLRPFAPSGTPDARGTLATQQAVATTPIERVAYVAALADKETNKTMAFVMWDDRNAMMSVHRMMGGDAAPAGKSEQLWGIMPDGRKISLGMLPPGKVVNMKMRNMNHYVQLAISVEPEGGSRDAHGPSGPVVCIGKLMATA
jgi:anti-sigma-K factor RskA